ncbi:MAG: hypothetical protein KOO60_07810 [Gemmatimonadales bacterium]|nr:hypothetical protein [Gemmatimonadales bacterium]
MRRDRGSSHGFISLIDRVAKFRDSLLLMACLAACAGPSLASGLPAGTAYLGQPLPGDVPLLFAPGIVNTGMTTRDMAIMPDGREIYFCLATANHAYAVICVTRYHDGTWTDPEVAPFSGSSQWIDLEPCISPDGRQFFFYSTRPSVAGSEGDQDLWVMDRQGDNWSAPRSVGEPVNSPVPEYFPSVTDDGTLFFCRADPETRIHNLFLSRWIDDHYQEPELLPEAVNAGRNRFNAFVFPAGDRIIVPVAGHPENLGGVDYWLSFHDDQGDWAGPVNLGPVVNDGSRQTWSPYVSPDGAFFFFMSARTIGENVQWPRSWSSLQAAHCLPGQGRPGIFWMRAGFLDQLSAGQEVPEPTKEQSPAVDFEPGAIEFPSLTGPYLGQDSPGLEPELFAPGVVSTGLNERDLIFSPDGRTMLFGMLDLGLVTLLETRFVEGAWTEPVTAPFHADPDFACLEPTFSGDGKTVLFLTNRAAPGQEQGAGWANQNIFSSSFDGGSWSEPTALPVPITTDGHEYFPSLASDGTLYFSRVNEDRHTFLWMSEPDGAGFAPPQRLPETVNIGTDTYNTFVAPDESFLIACVSGHSENLGPADYWVSFRDDQGVWQSAVNLGERFNGPDRQAQSASLSPDGRFLFFSSSRPDPAAPAVPERWTRRELLDRHAAPGNGGSDIWWVDSGILTGYR